MKTEYNKYSKLDTSQSFSHVIYVLEIIRNSCIYMVQVLHKVCYCSFLPNSMFIWIT